MRNSWKKNYDEPIKDKRMKKQATENQDRKNWVLNWLVELTAINLSRLFDWAWKKN